jgi:hypothetical protein
MSYVAVIFFCVATQCGMISVDIPFEQESDCQEAVRFGADRLAAKGATLINGQCVPVRREYSKKNSPTSVNKAV